MADPLYQLREPLLRRLHFAHLRLALPPRRHGDGDPLDELPQALQLHHDHQAHQSDAFVRRLDLVAAEAHFDVVDGVVDGGVVEGGAVVGVLEVFGDGRLAERGEPFGDHAEEEDVLGAEEAARAVEHRVAAAQRFLLRYEDRVEGCGVHVAAFGFEVFEEHDHGVETAAAVVRGG